jgi:cysteine synthase
MGDSHRPYLGTAFVAGVLVTVALTEIYHRSRSQSTSPTTTIRDDAATDLQDNKKLLSSVRHGPPAIVEGVEGCIGNTPLLRIKSLSDETGCEILAKAEVRT